MRQGDEIGEVELDFALMREVVACRSDRPGITEMTASAAPRLERIRSLRLRSPLLGSATQLVVVDGDDVVEFTPVVAP
jgi:hypothetical protein